MSKVIGSSLLIAGCCIGAGMLGMPVLSGPYGLFPTLAMFGIGFSYMLLSGFVITDLLIDEAHRGTKHVHLLSLSESILGVPGRYVTWGLFGFLFYAVLTAYTIGTGKLIQEVIQSAFPFIRLSVHIYTFAITCLAFVLLTRAIRVVDLINRWFLVGLASAYICLLVMSSTEFTVERLFRAHWSLSVLTTLPVIAFSFGYHNLLPTVASYLNYDRRKIRQAIVLGISIPLIIYIVWEMMIFGIIPFTTHSEWVQFIQSGDMITSVIADSVAIPAFVDMARLFAFFAIITSYVTVGMSMADFLRDGLSEPRNRGVKERSSHRYAFLALAPPFLIGYIDPSLFLSALSYSGGVIAMLLFGILPALFCIMRLSSVAAISSAYSRRKEKLIIALLLVGGLFIMSIEICRIIGLQAIRT